MADLIYFGVKGIILKEDKVLVLYSNWDGKRSWDFPGGRMSFGEHAEQTLIREVKEETNLDIKPVQLIDTWNFVRDEKFHVTGIFYECSCEEYDITISEEHDGYEWVPVDQLTEIIQSRPYISRMKNWAWACDEALKVKKLKTNILSIDTLIPNNLFLNGDKVLKVEKAYDTQTNDLLPPVLVSKIDGEWSLIDGHSRVYVAWKHGHKTVEAVVEPLENIPGPSRLYESIHQIVKEKKRTHIKELEKYVLNKEDHQKQWVDFCTDLMETIK